MSAHVPLRHMTRKKVNNLSKNKEYYTFQVGRMSIRTLNRTINSSTKLISFCLINFILKINTNDKNTKT